MVTTNGYIASTYAHLFVATLVTLASAEVTFTDNKFAALIFGIIAVVLIFIIMPLPPGMLKYALFFGLLVCLGQVSKTLIANLNDQGLLLKTYAMVAGLFLAISVVAFFDKQNFLGWGGYLFVGLVGLLLGRIAVWIAGLAGAPGDDLKTWDQILSYVGVVLFSAYTAYDTQVLKRDAQRKNMLRNPDYINSSVGLYLDILNLFSNIGDLAAD